MTPVEIGLGLSLFGAVMAGGGIKAGLWSAKKDSVRKDVCQATHEGLDTLMKSQHREVLARLDKMNGRTV